jgi:hypothetical protein
MTPKYPKQTKVVIAITHIDIVIKKIPNAVSNKSNI